MASYSYQGRELELFQHAVRWKSYYASHLAPYITGDVLEVGAGIGGTARFLCRPDLRSWACLEPDDDLARHLAAGLTDRPLPIPSRVARGTLGSLDARDRFDTILYIDVLEHIEDDRAELARAAARLRPGGRVVVLAPAHNGLFSEFDKAVGHYRRYDLKGLRAAAPSSLTLVRGWYLDAVGMAASLANRLVLHAGQPTPGQIAFWDGRLVPISRWIDPLCGHRLGKTVVVVWRLTT